MKTILILCIAALIGCNAVSQNYDNVWVFGDSALLDFSSGVPTAGSSVITTKESCASISNEAGELQFYTNGRIVWNRNHQMMPNGDSLHIGKIGGNGESSITQGVIILSFPGSTNLSYIFQIQADSDSNYGIEYSIVDMIEDDGMGNVIQKNIELYNLFLFEKMHGVKHGNGRDWWLLVRNYTGYGTDTVNIDFVRFLITPLGIEGPFYQEIGPVYDEELESAVWGQMIFSSDGNKLLYTRGSDINIYDFNRCTGELSNLVEVKDIGFSSAYGCSFSPDGRRFYVSDGFEKGVYQFCLDCPGVPIDSTKKLIYDGPTGSYLNGGHLLGPDGKIYIATAYQWIPSDVFNYRNQNLCVINNPNAEFPYCDFDTNTVSLGDHRVILGLPNMPNYSLGPLVGSECDTIETALEQIENINQISVYPNPANDFITIKTNVKEKLMYSIRNVDGKELLFGEFNSEEIISLTEFSTGIYFVEIKAGSGRPFKTEKIVVE